MLDQDISIKVADKDRCPCAKCIYGMFGGWSNWKCAQYKDGKPEEVLYGNKSCEKFEDKQK